MVELTAAMSRDSDGSPDKFARVEGERKLRREDVMAGLPCHGCDDQPLSDGVGRGLLRWPLLRKSHGVAGDRDVIEER